MFYFVAIDGYFQYCHVCLSGDNSGAAGSARQQHEPPWPVLGPQVPDNGAV